MCPSQALIHAVLQLDVRLCLRYGLSTLLSLGDAHHVANSTSHSKHLPVCLGSPDTNQLSRKADSPIAKDPTTCPYQLVSMESNLHVSLQQERKAGETRHLGPYTQAKAILLLPAKLGWGALSIFLELGAEHSPARNKNRSMTDPRGRLKSCTHQHQ